MDTITQDCICCEIESDCIDGLCQCCNDYNYKLQKQADLLTLGLLQEKGKVEQLEAELEKHRWIPVSERLPAEGHLFLWLKIYPDSSRDVFQGILGGCSVHITAIGSEKLHNFTYWKPIILPAQALKDKGE